MPADCPPTDAEPAPAPVPAPALGPVLVPVPAPVDSCCWMALLAHRQRLLVLARAQGLGHHDAEDVVHDALLKAAQVAELDAARLGGLLVLLLRQSIIALYRRNTRDCCLQTAALAPLLAPGPDEQVCDEAHAKWLLTQARQLRSLERRALLARAEGLSMMEVAARLGITAKAAESALGRARRALRDRDRDRDRDDEHPGRIGYAHQARG